MISKLDKIDNLYIQIKQLKKNKKHLINEEIKQKQRERELLTTEVHNEYVKTHKKRLILLDVLFCLFLLCNLGALLLTNMLVMKTSPDKTLHEANPITAATYGFETKKVMEFFATYMGFIVHLFAWAYLISTYIVGRRKFIVNDTTYYLMLASVIGFGYILLTDFVNDLGYWIGKLIWGVTH